MNAKLRSRDEVTERLNLINDLARQGRSNTVTAGPIMVIWGVAIALAGFYEARSSTPTLTVAAWIIPVTLAYVATLLVVRMSRSDERAVTWRSRAIYRVWVAAGTAIVIFNVGEELRHAGLQSESEAATALILSVAALATAELANRRLLIWTGVAWLVVAGALFVAQSIDALSLLTIAAVSLQIAPGIALVQKRWKA